MSLKCLYLNVMNCFPSKIRTNPECCDEEYMGAKGLAAMKINDILKQFPDFQQWVKNKKLTAFHLSLLTEFSDMQILQALLSWIGRNRPSHSQGVQVLELAGELLLMGIPLDAVFETSQKPEILLKKLKKLRHPLASKKEEQKANIVQAFPWPEQMNGRWIRQNDRTGLEVQFRCFSTKEFKQKIQSLQHIVRHMEEKKQNPWSL